MSAPDTNMLLALAREHVTRGLTPDELTWLRLGIEKVVAHVTPTDKLPDDKAAVATEAAVKLAAQRLPVDVRGLVAPVLEPAWRAVAGELHRAAQKPVEVTSEAAPEVTVLDQDGAPVEPEPKPKPKKKRTRKKKD